LGWCWWIGSGKSAGSTMPLKRMPERKLSQTKNICGATSPSDCSRLAVSRRSSVLLPGTATQRRGYNYLAHFYRSKFFFFPKFEIRILVLPHRIWSCAWAFVADHSQIVSIFAFWQSIDGSGELRLRNKTGPKRHFFQTRNF